MFQPGQKRFDGSSVLRTKEIYADDLRQPLASLFQFQLQFGVPVFLPLAGLGAQGFRQRLIIGIARGIEQGLHPIVSHPMHNRGFAD